MVPKYLLRAIADACDAFNRFHTTEDPDGACEDAVVDTMLTLEAAYFRVLKLPNAAWRAQACQAVLLTMKPASLAEANATASREFSVLIAEGEGHGE